VSVDPLAWTSPEPEAHRPASPAAHHEPNDFELEAQADR